MNDCLQGLYRRHWKSSGFTDLVITETIAPERLCASCRRVSMTKVRHYFSHAQALRPEA